MGSPNHYRPWWLFSSPSSLCIHSIRPRNFWGEKQSIFHPHQPHFNKWDSCFMQLIWWQSGRVGGLGAISCSVEEERQLQPAAKVLRGRTFASGKGGNLRILREKTRAPAAIYAPHPRQREDSCRQYLSLVTLFCNINITYSLWRQKGLFQSGLLQMHFIVAAGSSL